MKKRVLIKILVPLTALVLTGCDFSFSDLINKITGKTDSGQTTPEEDKTPSDTVDYPDSIKINSSLTLNRGEEKALTVTYNPSNSLKDVSWSSNDSNVVSVENGVVLAKSVGSTTVVATTKNKNGENITSTCNVTVQDPNNVVKTKLKYTYDDYMSNNFYHLDNCPLTGNPKLLVVPIWFTDSDSFISFDKKESVRNDISHTFFGNNEEMGWHSVSSFYNYESKGKLTLGGIVTDWYEPECSYSDFEDPGMGGYKTQVLVYQVASWFFENNPNESKSSYDINRDGYLDGVILVYGAPDSDNLGSETRSNLWAYTNWLMPSSSIFDPNPNVFFWGSYDFMYSKGDYALGRTGKSSYGRGDTRHTTVDAHCYIHEMGHVLGLPDYYDYSGQYNPAGGFSMQDYNVGGHDAYSVMAYGWAEPYIVKDSTTITLKPFQTSNEVVLLANHEVNSPFDEYLLLEFYTPTGLNEFDAIHKYNYQYPQGPNKVGIRLWHVDARLTWWIGLGWSEELTTDPKHGSVYHAMTNTYAIKDDPNESISPLGEDYANYDVLHLIRRDNNVDGIFDRRSLFDLGDVFNTSEYTSQFVNSNLMDDGSELGWSFTVESLDSTSATISFAKI